MDATLTVGRLASERPYSIPVLQRHRLDFCCGGAKPLADACAERGVDLNALLAEIEAARPRGPDRTDWTREPLERLVEHIVARHHRPLDEELPRLGDLARKVARVHGDTDRRLLLVRDVLTQLADDLFSHMGKEEAVLFPWIAGGRGASAGAPIRVMTAEHDEHAVMLRQLRELTDDHTPPEHACGSWRALLHGLSELERDLQEHIHLENNVLFPRALSGV